MAMQLSDLAERLQRFTADNPELWIQDDLEFRVLGFRVWVLGFRARVPSRGVAGWMPEGLGFGVLGFRVYRCRGLGFMGLRSKCSWLTV